MKYCGKRIFTKEKVLIAVEEIKQHPDFSKKYPDGVRYYECDLCEGYHLTGITKKRYKYNKAVLRPEQQKKRVSEVAKAWEKKFGIYSEDDDFDGAEVNPKGEYNKRRKR